jgi:hypothetical protein
VISKKNVAVLQQSLQELAELRQKLGAVAAGAAPVPNITTNTKAGC